MLIASGPASAAAQPPEFSYRFELVRVPALEVRVHAEIPGAPGDTTTLEVDEQWGGVRAGGEDISRIQVTDDAGAELAFTRPEPFRIVVVHAPGARLRVSYTFAANEHQLQSDPSQSRRPIVNPHLFHTVGHLALLFPTYIDDEAPCTVRLGWDGFDQAGWRVVSSWGAGPGERTLKTSLYDLGDALYVAGDIHLMTRDVHGFPVTITVAGDDWSFTPEAFADVCEHIVSAERGFFQDYARHFYWISLIATGPLDQKGRNIGGTGLNNCFSLTISPHTPLDPGDGSPGALVGVIAHEMFHDWNGILIKRRDPEELVYWFSEGFTDFYARRLRYRAGLIDAQQYAVSLNESLNSYFTNPWRDEPNARIKDDFWNDRDVQRLPYYRGDIVAMILDDAIRRKSNGAQSLDDVMRLLAANARAGAVVDTDNLFATFLMFADQATLVSLRNLVESGGAPKLEGVFAPCLTVEPIEAPMYDIGFNLEESTRNRVIAGVRDGSPAARAGLRDGMTLKSWSVQRGDATSPVALTVQDADGTRDITYLPQGPAVPSYRATVTGTERDCSSL